MDWILVDQNKDKNLSQKKSMSTLRPSRVAPSAMNNGLSNREKETMK